MLNLTSKQQQFVHELTNIYNVETLVSTNDVLQKYIKTPLRHGVTDTSLSFLLFIYLGILADSSFANSLHINKFACQVELPTWIVSVYRHLSPYIKTDGTEHYCSTNVDKESQILDWLKALSVSIDNGEFTTAYSLSSGCERDVASRTANYINSKILRIVSLTTDDALDFILRELTIANSYMYTTEKMASLTPFSTSFSLDEMLESKRSLGARSFWRTEDGFCSESDAPSVLSFVIYAVYIQDTYFSTKRGFRVLDSITPRSFEYSSPLGNRASLLSLLIVSLLGEFGSGDKPVKVSSEPRRYGKQPRLSSTKPLSFPTTHRSYSTSPPGGRYVITLPFGGSISCPSYEEAMRMVIELGLAGGAGSPPKSSP